VLISQSLNHKAGNHAQQAIHQQTKSAHSLVGTQFTLCFFAADGVDDCGVEPLSAALLALVSFLQWDLQRSQTRFIWFQNYADMLRDTRMWEALGNKRFIIVVAVTAELLIGLILAQTLRGDLPGKRFIMPLRIFR